MKKARKVVSMLLAVTLLALSCGCTAQVKVTSTPTETVQTQGETASQPESIQPQETQQSATDSDDRWEQMQAATLQYPSSNDEWKYNVYDCYVELTEYTGSYDDKIIIPGEIDDLPVWKFSAHVGGIIELPDSLLWIGDLAFNWMKNESIDLPDGLIHIGNAAFLHSSLKSVNLPETVESIGDSAFSESVNLAEVVLPASVKSVGSEAFALCNCEKKDIYNIQKFGIDLTIYSTDAVFGDEIVDYPSTIHGYAGSTAAQYCAENDIDFQVIE